MMTHLKLIRRWLHRSGRGADVAADYGCPWP
jgi:hypothetical protein